MSQITNFHRSLKDSALDFHSKGILAYLAFVAKDQKAYKDQLEQVAPASSLIIKKSFSKLENGGYVERILGEQQRVWYRYIDALPSGIDSSSLL